MAMRIIRQSRLTCLGIVLLRKLRIKCHFHLLSSVYRSFDCFVYVYLTECCRQVLMRVFYDSCFDAICIDARIRINFFIGDILYRATGYCSATIYAVFLNAML